MAKKNVTFQDIADYTHFSKTTISRYFNRPETLTEKNRQVISEALEKLGYQENKVAKILAKGHTEMIGILIPNLYLHFYPMLVEQFLNTYEKYGYKFLLFKGSRRKDVERQFIRELLAYKVEGLIVVSHTLPSLELASCGVPVVAIEREDFHVDSVSTNSYLGGVQATELLAGNNCDIYIHVNSLLDKNSPTYGRLQGFVDTCGKYGFKNRIYEIDMGECFEDLKAAVVKVTDSIEAEYPGLRKGIFLSNDTLAHTMLNQLYKKYGCLPEEYRLVGFDNSPIAEESIIPISTIGQQTEKIVLAAMEILTEAIACKKNLQQPESRELIHRMIPPVLYQRETAGTE